MYEIKVSIICNAYNQEKYISDALEGFVMQKTNFPFEVLVHDDASTDKTPDIIRRYETKYPEIIKPIYETENQYSKGNDSLTRIQCGRVKGKYIALCEGDDYWTDPYKLQKQYDALEAHPEINICATKASLIKENLVIGELPKKEKSIIIPVSEVILGDGPFVATATIMYRTNVETNSPSFFDIVRIDYALQIAGSLNNGMLFLSDNTAAYRVSTENSWTVRMKDNVQEHILNKEKIIEMLVCLDKDTNYVYHHAVDNRVRWYRYNIALLEDRYRDAMSKEYREFFEMHTIKGKALILLGCVVPTLSHKLRGIKRYYYGS